MTDYNSLKVPELKKLLGDRSLLMSGNKADLIARLQENDKKPAAVAGMSNIISIVLPLRRMMNFHVTTMHNR